MDRPRRTLCIDRKTESLWQEDDALCLVGQKGVVYYELLKPGKTVNTKRLTKRSTLIPNDQQQLIDLNRSLLKKRPEYQKRQYKVIFLHDNPPSHTVKPVRDTLEALSWEAF